MVELRGRFLSLEVVGGVVAGDLMLILSCTLAPTVIHVTITKLLTQICYQQPLFEQYQDSVTRRVEVIGRFSSWRAL